jgi:NAD(P)-dependent dehydrogenase (short-subunit alcohol dehydrogenase family)
VTQALADKRIIVTGAARGIGASLVRAYVSEGARVLGVDVDAGGFDLARTPTGTGPGHAFFHRADVRSREDVAAAFAAAEELLGGLDVLVNVAGIERRAAAESISDAEWDAMFDINVKGTMLTNQAAFPRLRERGGSIVNFGSDSGLVPHLNGAHYSAAKAAVMAWTRTIAHEWGRFGIRANSVLPAIHTPMYEEYLSRLPDDELQAHRAKMRARIPLGGQLGDPDRDLAPVLVFLASNASRFITGQLIAVDGGKVSVR